MAASDHLSPEQFANTYREGEHDIPLNHLHGIRDPESVDHPSSSARVRASMEVHGQKEPVHVWRAGEGTHMDDGHHRLQAAMDLGWKTLRTQVEGY